MSEIVKISITNSDGTVEDYKLDLDLEALTMREAVVLEETMGGERFDKMMAGTAEMRPTVIQAMIYAKLKTHRPDIGLNDFDVDFGDLFTALGDVDDPKELNGSPGG